MDDSVIAGPKAKEGQPTCSGGHLLAIHPSVAPLPDGENVMGRKEN
jgi:hypothetical protein